MQYKVQLQHSKTKSYKPCFFFCLSLKMWALKDAQRASEGGGGRSKAMAGISGKCHHQNLHRSSIRKNQIDFFDYDFFKLNLLLRPFFNFGQKNRYKLTSPTNL